MLGGASGLTLHAGAAALGVSALLAASATASATLKLVGIAYLLYLAVKMLLSARTPTESEREARGGRPFVQGFVSNALNPKVALFFLTTSSGSAAWSRSSASRATRFGARA